jgi:hypothetical protein
MDPRLAQPEEVVEAPKGGRTFRCIEDTTYRNRLWRENETFTTDDPQVLKDMEDGWATMNEPPGKRRGNRHFIEVRNGQPVEMRPDEGPPVSSSPVRMQRTPPADQVYPDGKRPEERERKTTMADLTKTAVDSKLAAMEGLEIEDLRGYIEKEYPSADFSKNINKPQALALIRRLETARAEANL